jgi:HlyD family secretion protein
LSASVAGFNHGCTLVVSVDMRRFALPLLILLALGGCQRARPAPANDAKRMAAALAARRGPFERRLLLTGEVDAVAAAELKVPRISAGRSIIRWLEADGAPIKAGQKLVELDNANFVSQVKERSLTVSQAEIELRRQEWQNELDQSDRVLEVERKRSVVRRAEIDADVPEGILPKRDFLEKQLALRRARADLEKAQEARDSQQRTAELDLGVRKLALEKVRRELKIAEQMIEALTIKAPTDGTVLIGDHWEGRKLQVADEVPVGHTLVRIPDMGQIRVKAWLSDVDDGRVATDMPAEIILDAYPDRVLRGKIVEIAPVAREVAERSLRRVFQVSVAIDHPGGADLRPGMSARVEVIAERQPDVVWVPRAALEMDGEGAAVHLAGGARMAVTLGPCNAEACVAMSGVEAGAPLRRATP